MLWLFFLALLLPFPALSADNWQTDEALPGVSVLADPSLALPLNDIAQQYARDSGVVVTLSFSANLEKSNIISEGAGVDVLITAKPAWLDQLRQQGVMDIHSETAVAGNRLAFVSPDPQAPPMRLTEELRGVRFVPRMKYPIIAVGSPETMVEGVYTRTALRHLDKEGDLEPVVLYVKERDRLYEMIRESKGYAILFLTDARSRGMNVIDVLPDTSHEPILYRSVALAGENMDEARRFIGYLRSPAAQGIFAARGFYLPN